MLRGFSPIPRLNISLPQLRFFSSKMSGTPACRKFVALEDGEDTVRNNSNGFKIRLVSYNMLAQVYVKSSYFPHSPSSCLKWNARSHAVLTYLKKFNADFLCLQELDEYENFYRRNMECCGYSSIYVQRSGRKRDGCGIFYNSNSAELLLNEEISYNDLARPTDHGNFSTGSESCNILDFETSKDTPIVGVPNGNNLGDRVNLSKSESHGDRGDPNDPRVRLKRDCVGLLAAFKLNDPSHHVVVVANTHIYWDPEWTDVKLAQAKYLLLRLSQFKEIVSNKYSCTPSVIVAGDFNSTPGDEVYRYLVSADTATELPEVPSIRLKSLYDANGGEPSFTNYTPGFTGTLDYIFLSDTHHLKPIGLLEVPGPGSSDIIGGLPNHHHPSDHLPIGGDFEIRTDPSSCAVLCSHSVEVDFLKLKIKD